MSFRKRNTDLTSLRTPQSSTSPSAPSTPSQPTPPPISAPGTRPSPHDGRPTTSTGTPSLDSLLAGHQGLPLGHSLLIEEHGVTDYSGALAKYFAAEGVVQGHVVSVVGVGQGWGASLPGVVGVVEDAERGKGGGDAARRSETREEKERMKIAWRYEGLGEFGRERERRAPAVNRAPSSTTTTPTSQTSQQQQNQPFCHTYDLTKKLTHPSVAKIAYIPIGPNPTTSPFDPCINHLRRTLETTPPELIHRLIGPSLLSPALYPPQASDPEHLLAFAHQLRALLRQYHARLVVLTTLPLSLYPRTSGTVRWLEHLFDGVLELTPFPHTSSVPDLDRSGASTMEEEKPMGLVKVHKLPVFHERGGGEGVQTAMGEDLAFTVSKKRFEIRPFSLPPAEGDVEAQAGGEAKGGAKAMEF